MVFFNVNTKLNPVQKSKAKYTIKNKAQFKQNGLEFTKKINNFSI